jgi:hypothetical protein
MSTWDSVKPWISKLAPMIGTALGGPLGGAAGALLSSALGTKDASPDSIQAAIQSGNLTGDQIVALKQAEENFSLQMAAMNIKSVQDMQNLAFEDRDSARKREETVKDWTPRIMAYVVALIWLLINGTLLYMAITHNPIQSDMGVFTAGIMKTIDAALMLVLGYYFGSSSGQQAQIDKPNA